MYLTRVRAALLLVAFLFAALFATGAEDPKSVTVYVTKTGAKYHDTGCRFLGKSKIPIALEDAKKKYEPCGVCKPPR